MEHTGLYITAAWILVFVAELIAGRHRGIYRKEDYLVVLGCQLFSLAGTRPLFSLLIGGLLMWLLPAHKGALADQPFWIAFPILLVVNDIAFYWGHRWAHTMRNKGLNWLWMLHRTHHAGKYMNVMVNLRINPFWSLVVPTAWVLGIAIYLGLEKAAAATLATVFIWNLITHSNFLIDDPLRRNRWTRPLLHAFEHIVITPSLHHVHHGYGRDGKNYKNFAVVFAFIDWMFGTLHIPQGRPEYYGLPGAYPHWAEEMLYPLYRAAPGK